MAGDKGQAQLPPADLADRTLPMTPMPIGGWWRIGKTKNPPLHFSDDIGWRFSRPGQRIAYLGDDPETCFWEVFWDDLVGRAVIDRRLDDARVLERSLWQLTLPRPIQVIDTMDPKTLNALGAHGGTFLGPYPICQEWAAALRAHRCRADGIRYESARRKGHPCLALFAERTEADAWGPPGPGVLLNQAMALAPLLEPHGLTTLRTVI